MQMKGGIQTPTWRVRRNTCFLFPSDSLTSWSRILGKSAIFAYLIMILCRKRKHGRVKRELMEANMKDQVSPVSSYFLNTSLFSH